MDVNKYGKERNDLFYAVMEALEDWKREQDSSLAQVPWVFLLLSLICNIVSRIFAMCDGLMGSLIFTFFAGGFLLAMIITGTIWIIRERRARRRYNKLRISYFGE